MCNRPRGANLALSRISGITESNDSFKFISEEKAALAWQTSKMCDVPEAFSRASILKNVTSWTNWFRSVRLCK